MKNEVVYTEAELAQSSANLEKLKKSGILVTESEFNAAVNGADKTPENGFNVNSSKSTRRAKMWLLPGGSILCEQGDKHIFIPPTHKFAVLK